MKRKKYLSPKIDSLSLFDDLMVVPASPEDIVPTSGEEDPNAAPRHWGVEHEDERDTGGRINLWK